MPDGRVLIALGDDAFVESPTWFRLDDTDNLVAGIEIHRGRQTEFDRTETSTATVYLNDTDGLFDPDNSSSWITHATSTGHLDGLQIMLQLYDPCAAEWVPQFRGHIDEITWDFNPATRLGGELIVATLQLECVDLFDYLAGVEMIPGPFGDSPPAGVSEGTVYYAGTSSAGHGMQVRVEQALTNAGLTSGWYQVFTGNVELLETQYDPGDSVMSVVRDAVDAEFPGIANVYTDKIGRVAAHGRYAFLDPTGTASGTDWDFTWWNATDGYNGFSDAALIRPPLRWFSARNRIINAAMSYPRVPGGIDESRIPGQITIDTTSQGRYGYRSWSALDLIVKEGTTTGNDNYDECKAFGEFYVANYKNPKVRIEALTFKAIDPDHLQGPYTWGLLAGVDIGDYISLGMTYPSQPGLPTFPFLDLVVQGSDMAIRPLNPDYDYVELTLNVSPQLTNYGPF